MANSTVIIVPGITGSNLSYAISFGPFGLVWCIPSALIAGGFVGMRLPIASESLAGPLRAVTTPGGALRFYYGPLAAYLMVRGWRVTWPLADWRKPIADDAGRLAALIRYEATTGPVRIVAHSRGGLVTRKALGILGATDGPGLVSRVIGMGVPHTGSLAAAQCVSGDNAGTRLTQSLADIFPAGLPVRFLTKIITDVTRSWPALYELMPRPGAPWLSTSDSAALYSPGTWSPSETVPVTQYLSDAAANWAVLPPVPAWVDWIDLVGVGISTPDSIPSLEELAREGRIGFGGEGDGIVPLASAAQAPRRRITFPTNHQCLPIDPRVWEAVRIILRDGLAGDTAVAGRVLNI